MDVIPHDTITLLLQLSGMFGAVAAGAVYIKSRLVKQRASELHDLVETRGNKIEDLQAEIDELRQDMAQLKGEMQALHALKTTEIARVTAETVVSELLPFLKGV